MPKIVNSAGIEVGTNNTPFVVTKLQKTTIYGTYYFHSGILSVAATAHAATVGFLYFYNPVSSGKIARIVSMKIETGMSTALATPTLPRITVERGSFTGTPSGAIIPVAKGDSIDVANVLHISAASTGATNGATTVMGGKLINANATATANIPSSISDIFDGNKDVKDVILRSGEYLVVRQADAGTTADTRKAIVNMLFEEFI